MPSAASGGHCAQTIQPDCLGYAGHEWTCQHVEYVPLGWHRWQLSHCTAVFSTPKPFPGQLCFGYSSSAICTAPNPRYLRAGAEVVVTKAGKETSGLDRFYSSLYGKAVPGLSFFALSLIDLSERGSFPLRIEQSIRTEAEKAASKATKSRGRNPPRKSVRVGVRRAVRTRAR